MQPAAPIILRYDLLAAELQAELSKKRKANASVVFKLLDRLDQNEAAESGIRSAYFALTGVTLEAALSGALKGLDLLHARGLLTESTNAWSEKPDMAFDFAAMSKELKGLLKGSMNVSKKYKLFDILSDLRHDPELLANLRAEYAAAGGDLETDVKAKLEKKDPKALAYALSLLSDAPTKERINVSNAAEEADSLKIIAQIKADYGIDLDSQAGIAGEATMSAKAPVELQQQVRTAAWEYRELVAMQKALASFAPILGANRAQSSQAAVNQQVLKIAKLDQSIDERDKTKPENADKPSFHLESDTGGMAMAKQKAFAMYTAGTLGTKSELSYKSEDGKTIDHGKDFANNGEYIQANMIHELAHLLIGTEVDEFIKVVKYWKTPIAPDIDPATGHNRNPAAEEPVTAYGHSSAAEDLAETTKYYFMRPDELKAHFPVRFGFMEKCVKNWSVAKK
jgi:hypothetical protein